MRNKQPIAFLISGGQNPPDMPRIAQTIIVSFLLLFAGALAVSSLFMSFLVTDRFVSTVRLHTETQDPTLLRTQIEEINSTKILSQVITNLNLNKKWAERYKEENDFRTEQSIGLLRSQLEVAQSKGTYLMDVRVTDDDRGDAANIANEIAMVYITSDFAAKSPPQIVEAAQPALRPRSKRSNFAFLLSAVIAGFGLFLAIRSVWRRPPRPPPLKASAQGTRV